MLLALSSIMVEAEGCNPLRCMGSCHRSQKKVGMCRDECVCTEQESFLDKMKAG